MRSSRSVLILLMCIASGCASVPAEHAPPSAAARPAGQQGAGPRAERPTYTIGEKWIRSDGDFELVRMEKGRYIFLSSDGREIELTPDLSITKVSRGKDQYLQIDDPPPLAWPLEVGKSGRGQATWTFSGNRLASLKVLYEWKVEAFEEVKTVAGVFQAFRIVHTWRWRGWLRAGETERKVIMWYAPAARQFVMSQPVGASRFLRFQVLAIEEAAPLGVLLRDPRDDSQLDTGDVVVTGTIEGGRGVRQLAVSLNGREVGRQEYAPTPDMRQFWELPLRLEFGKNLVLVTVTDATGTVSQTSRIFYLRQPSSTQSALEGQGQQRSVLPQVPGPSAPGVGQPPSGPNAPPPLASGTARITLASPPHHAQFDQELLSVTGTVTSERGLQGAVVTLNGTEVSRLGTQRAGDVPLNFSLRLREGLNTIVVTVTEPAGSVSQEIRAVRYVKPVPLTVTVRYPEDRARMENEFGVIAAGIASSKGIARVAVTLNGTEVQQQTQRNHPLSLVVNAPLTFREGENVITVSATDTEGTAYQATRTVFFANPGLGEIPGGPAAPHEREEWAVIIGAGRYESREIPRLRYTGADATLLYQVLTGPGGFKPEHVLLVTDTTDRKATLRTMKWALGTFLARSAQRGDTVFIFFAGHGAPEEDREKVERDGVAKYLVPVDADPDDLYATAFPMDELQTIFARIDAERVVVFLDACYSGAAGGRTFAAKQMNVDEFFLERLARAKGRAILAASRPTEVALEATELGHGLFSYYLVEGLRGAADANKDGVITLQELFDYVQQQVTQQAKRLGGDQHPLLKGELEPTSPLLRTQR